MRFALFKSGGMAEWFKAAVLKTASPNGDVGSATPLKAGEAE